MPTDLLDDVTLRMPRREWMFDDLPRLPDDGRRYEVVHRSSHVSAAPAARHQLVAGWLARWLAATAPGDVEVVEAVGVDCGRSVTAPDVVVGSRRRG
jgi:hypothetical protein